MCVDRDVVMMNKGDTATVSVDSDAVCCTLLLRSDTATVSVDSGGMLSLLLIFYRMMLFLLVHCPVVLD